MAQFHFMSCRPCDLKAFRECVTVHGDIDTKIRKKKQIAISICPASRTNRNCNLTFLFNIVRFTFHDLPPLWFKGVSPSCHGARRQRHQDSPKKQIAINICPASRTNINCNLFFWRILVSLSPCTVTRWRNTFKSQGRQVMECKPDNVEEKS